MESKKCDQCDKVIEGYSIRHVEFLMSQHMKKHDNEARKNIVPIKIDKKIMRMANK